METRTEEIEKDIIVLKAVYGKQQGPLDLCPVRDAYTGGMKGVEDYTEEEKRKLARVVNQDTKRKITDGLIINRKDKAIDKIDWEWIKHNKEIAPDFESAQSSPQALFYVDDPEAETDKEAKAFENKFEAMKLISEATTTQRRDISRLLGIDMVSYSDKEVKVAMDKRADGKPEEVKKVLDAFKFYKTGNGKEMLFVYRLIDKRILKRDSDGNVTYGERTIGVNDQDAFNYLRKPENVNVMRKLYLDLKEQGAANGFSSLVTEEDGKDSEKAKAKGKGKDSTEEIEQI